MAEDERSEENSGLPPAEPCQEATTSPLQRANTLPQSPDSQTFAEKSSLVESEPYDNAQGDENTFTHRLKQVVGMHQNSSKFTLDCHVPQVIRSVDEYERGYGKVAAFEDTDPSFLIYRKFGWLHNRILLHLQDELTDLEDQLEDLDHWESNTGNPTKLRCRRLDDANPDKSERRKLLIQCREKLAEYDEVLFRLQKKQAIRKPTKRNQNSLYNLIDTTESILQSEGRWIRERDDLLALASDADPGWLNSRLAITLRRISKRLLLAIFRTPEQKLRTGSLETMSLISAERLDVLLRAVLTLSAAILVLLPVLVLWELQPSRQSQAQQSGRNQLLAIFFFTLLFSACCSIFTKARRQEVFAITAAYCAVLVVFLGNISNGIKIAGN